MKTKNKKVVERVRWTSEEDLDLLRSIHNAKTITSGIEKYSKANDRTEAGCVRRYHRLKAKAKLTEELDNSRTKLDTSYIGIKQPLSIPETNSPTYLKQEQVTMYRAELSDSLHDKAQDAVKANIRAILDAYDELRELPNADDSICHKWFYENKDMINYMLNTNPEELWK